MSSITALDTITGALSAMPTMSGALSPTQTVSGSLALAAGSSFSATDDGGGNITLVVAAIADDGNITLEV